MSMRRAKDDEQGNRGVRVTNPHIKNIGKIIGKNIGYNLDIYFFTVNAFGCKFLQVQCFYRYLTADEHGGLPSKAGNTLRSPEGSLEAGSSVRILVLSRKVFHNVGRKRDGVTEILILGAEI